MSPSPAAEAIGADALRGELLMRYGCIEGGAELLGRSIGPDPIVDPRIHARLGQALLHLDDLPAAIEHYDTAARLTGDGLAYSVLGVALTAAGRLDEALEAHRCALAAAPASSPQALLMSWNASHTLMASGHLPDGWEAYEARIPLGLGPAELTLPVWDTRFDPTSVLVVAEQGVADEVMFGSCLPDLVAEADAGFIECDPRLVTLVARSFPSAEVGPHGRWSGAAADPTENAPELAIPAGSLPRRYRPSVDDFPSDGAYLVPDPERVSAWEARLGGGKWVGISWKSTRTGPVRLREYAALAEWEAVLTQPDTHFVSLQAAASEQELADEEQRLGIRIHRWDDLDLLRDFEELAALIAAVDFVISPRGWIGFLAGALGTSTVMVANPHAWSELGTGSLPWFPAVTVVHRPPGDSWSGAIADAACLIEHGWATPPRGPAAPRPMSR